MAHRVIMIPDSEKEQVAAIIIGRDFDKEGINFFTPEDFSQQLAHMRRPKGDVIMPHVHKINSRKVDLTQEVLFIKRGKVRVDLYTQEKKYFESVTLVAGDVILLAHGGHGFEMLEESEIIEVKQGPYTSVEKDKEKFGPSPQLNP